MPERCVEAEVALRFVDHNLDQIRSIVAEFPGERLWQRPQSNMVSLGNLVCHVAGSMRDWIENGLGQGDWRRDRQREFDRENGMEAEALIQHLDATRDHCATFLAAIDEQTWCQARTFRIKSYTVRDIVLHQLEHVAYHAGQAAFLRRIVAELDPSP